MVSSRYHRLPVHHPVESVDSESEQLRNVGSSCPLWSWSTFVLAIFILGHFQLWLPSSCWTSCGRLLDFMTFSSLRSVITVSWSASRLFGSGSIGPGSDIGRGLFGGSSGLVFLCLLRIFFTLKIQWQQIINNIWVFPLLNLKMSN